MRRAGMGMLAALLAGCACSSSAYVRVGLPPGEVLARHATVARYEGVEEVPCRHRTAECPDGCAHGGRHAVFRIETYTAYERPGEHGDEKQERFLLRLGKNGVPDAQLSPALLQVLARLSPGQRVKLEWAHVYRSDAAGSRWPERIVTRLAE